MPTATLDAVVEEVDNHVFPGDVNLGEELHNGTPTTKSTRIIDLGRYRLRGQRMADFFRSDGSFDFHSYLRSDLYRQRTAMAERKIRRLIVAEINRNIEDVVRQETSTIKITQEAWDKSQYIAQRFGELTRHVLNDSVPYEVSFFLIGHKTNGEPIITDVYIGHEQEVRHDHCEITGFGAIRSHHDIKDRLRKEIIGWAHSHGNISNEFSHEDKSRLRDILNSWGAKKTVYIPWGDISLRYEGFTYTPTFIVNANRDAPALRVQAKHPRLVIEGDTIKRVIEENHTDLHGIAPRIEFVEGADTCSLDTDRIDEDLIGRIILPNGERLSDKYTGVERPPSNYTLPTDRGARTQPAVHISPNNGYSDPIIESLKRRTSNYGHRMQEYYTPLFSSENNDENIVGTIGKILAGDYRANLASIRDGNVVEDSSANKLNKWSDRLEAVISIYVHHKGELMARRELLNPLWDIIGNNRYANRMYGQQINEVKQLFS